ncbi:MAG TPA: hypothetical protein VNP95_03140 [Thermomicrobiales bacterium]|nr:hypothetical protein [Thermomicrobiales bacterium]
MTDEQHTFTVDDLEYDIVTTLSTLLQSEQVIAHYAKDFEEAGQPEIAAIFKTLLRNNQQTATDLRDILRGMLADA